MRSIHMHIRREYGEENVRIFCQWEKMENKMADFSNHRQIYLEMLKRRHNTSQYQDSRALLKHLKAATLSEKQRGPY